MKHYGITPVLTPGLAPIGENVGPALSDYDDYFDAEYDPREGLGEYEGFDAQSAWDAVEFARDSQAYIAQEESMGFLRSQFQSYRSWWEILGLSYEMTNLAQSGKDNSIGVKRCCDDWERRFAIPKLGHLIQMTRDAQISYVNGIQDEVFASGSAAAGAPRFSLSDIEGISWDQLQFFYADIITARENIWKTLIEQIEAGTTTRTPLEMEALALAESWRQAIMAGGIEKENALSEAGITQGGKSTSAIGPISSVDLSVPVSASITRPSLGSILPSTNLPPWLRLTLLGGSLYIGVNYFIRRKK